MFEQLETREKIFRKIWFSNSGENSKIEQRITWSSRLVEKWHPEIAVVNRIINLFNDNVMQHFRKNLKNRQKQVTLDRFLFEEKSSGVNVNELQLSTSGFRMKEEVISLLLLLID
jgi:hypothetical protein